jgi:hypothetical protein
MRHFVINVEEKIGKTVGRRQPGDPLRVQPNEIENAKAWRRNFGGVRIPKGAFRFSSHKEADQWLMTHLVKNAKI